jgi:hypothetical protein
MPSCCGYGRGLSRRYSKSSGLMYLWARRCMYLDVKVRLEEFLSANQDYPPAFATLARECRGCVETLCKGCHEAEHLLLALTFGANLGLPPAFTHPVFNYPISNCPFVRPANPRDVTPSIRDEVRSISLRVDQRNISVGHPTRQNGQPAGTSELLPRSLLPTRCFMESSNG